MNYYTIPRLEFHSKKRIQVNYKTYTIYIYKGEKYLIKHPGTGVLSVGENLEKAILNFQHNMKNFKSSKFYRKKYDK